MFGSDDEDYDLFVIITLFAAAVWYKSLRERSRLTRSAILQPRINPWRKLFEHGDDKSFLEMTGFIRVAFSELKLCVYGDRGNGDRKIGRPSSLDSDGELGLYLLYVGSMMKIKYLYLLLGVVPTTANVTIRKIMDAKTVHLNRRKLKNHRAARVVFSNEDEMSFLLRWFREENLR